MGVIRESLERLQSLVEFKRGTGVRLPPDTRMVAVDPGPDVRPEDVEPRPKKPRLKLREQGQGIAKHGLDFPALSSDPWDSPSYIQGDVD